jgi:uncharacterized protein
MQRTCPDCAHALATHPVEGVELDICPACAGIWFDAGELPKLKSMGDRLLESVEDFAVPDVQEEQKPKLDRKCPACGGEFYSYRYMYNSPVTIEGCQNCGGTWVQDGELAQMVEYARLPREEVPPDVLARIAVAPLEEQARKNRMRAQAIARHMAHRPYRRWPLP